MTLSPEHQAEIDASRAATRTTLRPVAEGLEQRLYEALPALDHGFVRVVDYMGDDAAIVQAARKRSSARPRGAGAASRGDLRRSALRLRAHRRA